MTTIIAAAMAHEYNRQRIDDGGITASDIFALLDLRGLSLRQFVRGFQATHGLVVDGMFGPKTVAAIRTAASRRNG